MALRLPVLRQGLPEVLAGHESLDHDVRWAHSGEVPNMPSLLKGGELLLTTGLGMSPNAREQRKFVRALAERGVSGLVIELGQALPRISAALIDAAAQHGLPLVALHREVPFVDVTEAIHSLIVNRHLAILRRADDLHRRFTKLLLGGAGLPEVLSALASTIANPVLLEKPGEGVVYHAAHHTPGPEVIAEWEMLKSDTAARTAIISLPVPAADDAVWGRLVVLGLDSPVDEFDRAAADRTVALVSVALLRSCEEALLSARERGNFLADVAAGRIAATDSAVRAEALGLRHREHVIIPLVVVPTALGRGDDELTLWAPVWRALQAELRGRAVSFLIGSRPAEGDTLLLVSAASAEDRLGLVEHVAETLQSAADARLGRVQATVLVAGPAVGSWAEVGESLRLTAEAAQAVRGAPWRPWHDATVPDADRLLWALRGDDTLRSFVEQSLGALEEHDARRATKLIPTVEALCQCGWHKSDAARALFLRRQSLYPRIERVEELLGVDLDDRDTRFALELAVRARRLLSA